MYSNFTMMPGKGSLVKEHEHVLGGGGVRRGGGGGVLTSTNRKKSNGNTIS